MFSPFRSLALLALALLPAAHAATFEVVVGGPGGLRYNPETVTAVAGDVVRFIFQQKNHTATQSTFESPCTPAPGGFDSGYIPVAEGVTDGFPAAEFTVQNTDPIWVYCKQGAHCQAGMVFAINPGTRMDAFKAAAQGGTASQTTTPASTSTTAAPTATGTDIRVVVGGPGSLTFNPSNIQAKVGDTITFEFRQKNHSVIASSFEAPCVPLSQTTTEAGFDSGYFPVPDSQTTFQTWTVRVNDTKPIWAYCPQGNHCGQGMVFSANAVEGGARSFQAFQDLAKQLNGTAGTNTGGYGSSAIHTTISSASAAFAAILALAALL